MTSYGPDFAALYDVFHSGKDYAAEAQFVDALVSDDGAHDLRRLLDVACGTGRHVEEFVRLGYDVTGVDMSVDMIKHAKARCPGVDFHVQDIASLELDSRFDVVTCLFDSIGYMGSNERIGAGLKRLREHLSEDGFLVVEFWHAPAMLRGYDPLRYRSWHVDGKEVIRVGHTVLDPVTQSATTDYRVMTLDNDRIVSEWTETHVNRFFGIEEMRSLMSGAGFSPIGSYAGFTRSAAIELDSWHVVTAARPTRSR